MILSPYVNRHRLILHSASTNDDTAARGIGYVIDILPFVPHELAYVSHLKANKGCQMHDQQHRLCLHAMHYSCEH